MIMNNRKGLFVETGWEKMEVRIKKKVREFEINVRFIM